MFWGPIELKQVGMLPRRKASPPIPDRRLIAGLAAPIVNSNRQLDDENRGRALNERAELVAA